MIIMIYIFGNISKLKIIFQLSNTVILWRHLINRSIANMAHTFLFIFRYLLKLQNYFHLYLPVTFTIFLFLYSFFFLLMFPYACCLFMLATICVKINFTNPALFVFETSNRGEYVVINIIFLFISICSFFEERGRHLDNIIMLDNQLYSFLVLNFTIPSVCHLLLDSRFFLATSQLNLH